MKLLDYIKLMVKFITIMGELKIYTFAIPRTLIVSFSRAEISLY